MSGDRLERREKAQGFHTRTAATDGGVDEARSHPDRSVLHNRFVEQTSCPPVPTSAGGELKSCSSFEAEKDAPYLKPVRVSSGVGAAPSHGINVPNFYSQAFSDLFDLFLRAEAFRPFSP
ncbi:hypothetical protein RRG08_065482 [Elysia crispata]|uniref:Uncharacterized protein n=1 Tax=Elysia crispata TaxID=231223 RepID=A0AAE1AQ18_9GAST|nr:hypothetical protein RRG08_065482 [Elysia crispata]